jgi:hypothetical protein
MTNMDIHGYWISVGYGCLSIQSKKCLSISYPIVSISLDIQISDYPIGALVLCADKVALFDEGRIVEFDRLGVLLDAENSRFKDLYYSQR